MNKHTITPPPSSFCKTMFILPATLLIHFSVSFLFCCSVVIVSAVDCCVWEKMLLCISLCHCVFSSRTRTLSYLTISIRLSELLSFHYTKDYRKKLTCNSIYILGH